MTDLRPITLAGDPAAVRTLPGTSLPGPGPRRGAASFLLPHPRVPRGPGPRDGDGPASVI
jgi:hypothetical protein